MESDGSVTVVRPRYVNAPGEPSWARPDQLIAGAAWRVRATFPGAQLIHGHTAVTGLAAWRLARRMGLPLVLTFHGSDMNTWPDLHPERLDDLRSAVRDARAVIAVSAALVDRIRDVTGVTAIHLPIGSDHRTMTESAMPRLEARRLLGLPEDRVVVLFVGELKRAKGVRLLAEAILGLGDRFVGVFVGDGPEAGFGTADPRAAGLLDYRGSRPHDEVVHYLSAADVLVLPSYGEGLPTVLVEAGSLGVPVIASAVGGIPDMLGDDRGTILAQLTVSSVRSALTDFVINRNEAAAAADRLRRHVVDSHDVDRNSPRLLACYRAVIAGARVVDAPAPATA